MKNKRSVISIFLILLLGTNALAQNSNNTTIYSDNDGGLFKPNHRTDRHYTNGVKITQTSRNTPPWAKELADKLPGSLEGNAETALGYILGQNIYTPDRVDKPTRRKEKDRVFAGYLYSGLYLQRDNTKTFDHIELNIGIVGPSSLGKQSQQNTHNLFDISAAQGWDDQLNDELAADLIYLRKWKSYQGTARTQQTELIPEAGFMLGTLNRNLTFGITGRIGKNLPNDYGPGRLLAPVSATGIKQKANEFSYYTFARAGGKVIQHNRFLTGLTAEPFMGEFQIGIAIQYNQLEIGYSQTFQTREFKGQGNKNSFATITASCKF